MSRKYIHETYTTKTSVLNNFESSSTSPRALKSDVIAFFFFFFGVRIDGTVSLAWISCWFNVQITVTLMDGTGSIFTLLLLLEGMAEAEVGKRDRPDPASCVIS